MLLAGEFGVGQALLTMVYFFIFFIWIMLLIQVFSDIFRSKDLGGVAKTLWLLFVIVLPYLGVFVYLIARGQKMGENQLADMQAQQAAVDSYIKTTAGAPSQAQELAHLADLHKAGTLDDAEFAAMKAKIIG